MLIRQGQLTTARADLEETLAALQAQLGQRPEMNSLHDLLASGYSQLERVFRQIGEMARADEAARNAQTERDAARHSP